MYGCFCVFVFGFFNSRMATAVNSAFPVGNMMMNARVKVVLFGHSYVRRIGCYLSGSAARMNLRFDPEVASVECVGIGGTTVNAGKKCLVDWVDTVVTVLDAKPNIVFLQIGENDVGHRVDTLTVANSIAVLVHMLQDKGVLVIIGQLLLFPAFDKQVIVQTNMLLEERFKDQENVKFWKQTGYWQPEANIWENVHLNDAGNKRLFCNIRGAVSKSLRKVNVGRYSATLPELSSFGEAMDIL